MTPRGPRADLAPGRLDGTTILVPRSAERAAGLVRRLEERGARTVVDAVISRARVEDLTPVDDAVADLIAGRFAWVAVTSVNAIDELAGSARRHGSTLEALPTRWAAVGRATARALEHAGVSVDFRPTEASGAALAAELPRGLPGNNARVLLPLGDLATPTAADGLGARGFDPHVVTVYRTVAHAVAPATVAAWKSGAIDAVVLTSGSVVREVSTQLGPRDDVAGVAIGQPTARAAAEVGVRVDVVAATADDAGLEAAVLTALHCTGPTSPAPRSSSPEAL